MSLEVFEKLEAKVQQAIDTITLLQMEIEELKEKNNSLSQEVQNAQHQREELERENNHLKEQQNGWQERLQALLGRMDSVSHTGRFLTAHHRDHISVLAEVERDHPAVCRMEDVLIEYAIYLQKYKKYSEK